MPQFKVLTPVELAALKEKPADTTFLDYLRSIPENGGGEITLCEGESGRKVKLALRKAAKVLKLSIIFKFSPSPASIVFQVYPFKE